MVKRTFPLICLLFLWLVCLNCGAIVKDDSEARGNEGQPCKPDNTCNGDLVCGSHGICILPSASSCEGVTCSGHGICKKEGAILRCICEEGFFAEGLSCIKLKSSCEGVDCSSHGKCKESNGKAVCECEKGYYAKGLKCLKLPCSEDMVYVSAKGFCIDAFEFTIEQYVEFLNMYAPNNECPAGYKCLTPGKTSNIKKEGDSWVLIDSSRAKHPVVMVTLHGAEKACEAQGKKLCSSEEWESACKGEKGFIYPYGDVYEKGRCNNAGLGKKWSVPVGSLERCEGGYKGLFDMSGNVAEWTTEEVQGSKGEYYARGGSWFEGSPFPVTGTFCAARFAHWHESGMHFIGFRCCKDI